MSVELALDDEVIREGVRCWDPDLVIAPMLTGPGEPYSRLRRAFVYKDKPSYTPPHLARHRTDPGSAHPGWSRAQQTTAILART